MNTEQKLDHILATLTGYIKQQEAFNESMLSFKDDMLSFKEKQEAFNVKQEVTNNRLEDKVDSLRREMGEFRHQEELQHNATHRLIMQAFEHISEMKGKQAWEK